MDNCDWASIYFLNLLRYTEEILGKNNGLDKLNFDFETWLRNNYCIITIGTMYNLGLSIGDGDCLIIITIICNQFLLPKKSQYRIHIISLQPLNKTLPWLHSCFKPIKKAITEPIVC